MTFDKYTECWSEYHIQHVVLFIIPNRIWMYDDSLCKCRIYVRPTTWNGIVSPCRQWLLYHATDIWYWCRINFQIQCFYFERCVAVLLVFVYFVNANSLINEILMASISVNHSFAAIMWIDNVKCQCVVVIVLFISCSGDVEQNAWIDKFDIGK